MTPQKQLARELLTSAIEDASNPSKSVRMAARKWLGGEDAALCCQVLGLDVNVILQQLPVQLGEAGPARKRPTRTIG